MDENILKLRVGMFVVIAMLILGILIFLNSEGWSRQYTVYIKPVSAPSVKVGTPVRKNGILIGRVREVVGEDDYVLIGMALNEDAKVYENETARIGAESILGDAAIEILPLPRTERGEPLAHNDLLSTVALKRNPMELVDIALKLETEISETLEAIREAGASVNQAGEGIEQLSTRIQSAIDNKDSEFSQMIVEFRQTAIKAQTALDGFNRIFENLNDVVGDQQLKDEFRRAITNLPAIFDEVRSTITDTRRTVNSFQEVAAKTSTNLDNIEAFTTSLKAEGPEILTQINASLKNVEGLVTQIQGFGKTLQKLQTTEGTLGRLINDPEIYDNVKQTVENVRDVSDRLEPLVNDLRFFADAIARDPGVLGVRGAMDRRPEKTGYKGTAGRDGGINRN
jgi:phospholipid/cholesterol/gamma-HCH transport system substrate-binding protein